MALVVEVVALDSAVGDQFRLLASEITPLVENDSEIDNEPERVDSEISTDTGLLNSQIPFEE
jgi:hypothetical protein